ncbi:MAG: hypothetical protein V1718_03015 [archaeon]
MFGGNIAYDNIEPDTVGWDLWKRTLLWTIHANLKINSITTNPGIVGVNSNVICQANVTDNNVSVNFTITDSEGNKIIDNVNGTQSGDIWSSPSFTVDRAGTWYCNVIASNNLASTISDFITFVPGDKSGAVSTVVGATPFYTTSNNPQTCSGMKLGDICEKTWTVNATGDAETIWMFYTIFNPTTYSSYIQGNQTEIVNITISLDTTPPSVSLSLSTSSIYAGYSVTISCSASDSYLSSTSLSVTKPSGLQASATCGQAFSDTSATGTYTVTYSATDTSGNSASASQAFTVSLVGGGGGIVLPPVVHECETDANCTSVQVCRNYKCIELVCNSCEYIKDRQCTKYECCSDAECKTGEICRENKCIKEEKPAIPDTEKEEAEKAISEAKSIILKYITQKDTKEAEGILKEAESAFAKENYGEAKEIALKAKLLVENAPLLPEKETPKEGTNWSKGAAILILLILLVIAYLKRDMIKILMAGQLQNQHKIMELEDYLDQVRSIIANLKNKDYDAKLLEIEAQKDDAKKMVKENNPLAREQIEMVIDNLVELKKEIEGQK